MRGPGRLAFRQDRLAAYGKKARRPAPHPRRLHGRDRRAVERRRVALGRVSPHPRDSERGVAAASDRSASSTAPTPALAASTTAWERLPARIASFPPCAGKTIRARSKSPRITFHYDLTGPEDHEVPLAWKKQACALYKTPLRLAYHDLDLDAAYSVRAVLNGDEDWNKPIRVVANGAYVVRDGIDPHSRFLEFPFRGKPPRKAAWNCSGAMPAWPKSG